VKNSTRPCSSRRKCRVDDVRHVVGQVALARDADDVPGRVGGDDPLPELVVERCVTARGEGDGDDVGVGEMPRGGEGGPDEGRCGQVRRAGAHEREEYDGRPGGGLADVLEVLAGERSGDRDGDRLVPCRLLTCAGDRKSPRKAPNSLW
jgi:hypothetical protein